MKLKLALYVILMLAMSPIVLVGCIIGIVFMLLWVGFTFGVDVMNAISSYGTKTINDYERQRTHTIN